MQMKMPFSIFFPETLASSVSVLLLNTMSLRTRNACAKMHTFIIFSSTTRRPSAYRDNLEAFLSPRMKPISRHGPRGQFYSGAFAMQLSSKLFLQHIPTVSETCTIITMKGGGSGVGAALGGIVVLVLPPLWSGSSQNSKESPGNQETFRYSCEYSFEISLDVPEQYLHPDHKN